MGYKHCYKCPHSYAFERGAYTNIKEISSIFTACWTRQQLLVLQLQLQVKALKSEKFFLCLFLRWENFYVCRLPATLLIILMDLTVVFFLRHRKQMHLISYSFLKNFAAKRPTNRTFKRPSVKALHKDDHYHHVDGY